jgi:carboxyl-terminal processing protease
MALLDSKRPRCGRARGDAAIRRAVTLDDGGALILSVAKYYTPQGKAIQDTGVVPSVPYIESEPDAADEDQPSQPLAPKPPVKPEDDNLLKKAVEVLTKGPVRPPGQAAADPRARPESSAGPLGALP